MTDFSVNVEQLIAACARGQSVAWQEFIQRYDRLITGVVLRTANFWGEHADDVVKDLVQEVYARLCENQYRLLKEFESRHAGSIYGYLKAIAASVAHDCFRRLRSEKRGGARTDQTFAKGDIEIAAEGMGSPEAMERRRLFSEIDQLLQARLAPETQDRDRMIFWFRHRQGLTAQEISSLPSIGLTAKGVESTLRRLEQVVRDVMADRKRI